MKLIKNIAKIGVFSTIIALGIVSNLKSASANNSSVTCEQDIHNPSDIQTVARQGNAKAVLIDWNTTEFGPGYTPIQRCNIVSSKLHNLVHANGGSFKNLRLTNGPVNGRIVICALPIGQIQCNSSNMLFTLKRQNEMIAGRILGQLLNIGVAGAGTINEDDGTQVFVDLGEWAERNLKKSQAPRRQQRNVEPVVNPIPASGGGFN